LFVYSPLTRVDPRGEVVKADRGKAQPRHILSPGVPRNAWSSLRIVVEFDKPQSYHLDIGQNPDNAVKTTLYRENFVESPDGYLPDSLTKVSIPYQGFPADFRLPGQRVVTFWLDMWVDAKAEVDRVKVEPQLYAEALRDWIVYPMEVRIQQPVVPSKVNVRLPELPPVTAAADAVAHALVQAAVCNAPGIKSAPDSPGQLTGRQLMRRNVAQHMAIAPAPEELRALWSKATGLADPGAWCAKPFTPAAGPEWYLRLRDAIYRARGAED
jgi:hypothetical protein